MPMLTAPDTMPFCRNPGSAFGLSPKPTPPNTSFAPTASAQFVCANCKFFFAAKSVTFPLRKVHERPSTSRPGRERADREVLVADHAVVNEWLPLGPGETELQLRSVVPGHADVDGSRNE